MLQFAWASQRLKRITNCLSRKQIIGWGSPSPPPPLSLFSFFFSFLIFHSRTEENIVYEQNLHPLKATTVYRLRQCEQADRSILSSVPPFNVPCFADFRGGLKGTVIYPEIKSFGQRNFTQLERTANSARLSNFKMSALRLEKKVGNEIHLIIRACSYHFCLCC